jgi:hypothetical protein
VLLSHHHLLLLAYSYCHAPLPTAAIDVLHRLLVEYCDVLLLLLVLVKVNVKLQWNSACADE